MPGMYAAPRAHPGLGLVAWIGVLGAVLVGFTALGAGALAAPPLTRPGEWGAWAAAREPVEAAFAVLRLLVLALGWYLLAVTVLSIAARLSRANRAVRAIDVLTVPAVRRIVHGAVGVGMLGTVAAGVAAAAAGHAPGPTRADSQLVAAALDADPPETATIRRLHEGPTGGATTAPPAPEPAPATWVVESGDHLWSIAERVLAGAWQRHPTDGEIVPYWRQLIEANRGELADPANPDLIYPGQVLRLPAPPSP